MGEELTLLLLWVVASAGFAALMVYVLRSGYRKKAPRSLAATKPRFCWFPKFSVTVEMSADVLDSEDADTALGDRLETLGFDLQERNEVDLSFTRGSVHNFSTKNAKVDLIFSMPLESKTRVVVEYGTFLIAFDTGDLWALTTELKTMLGSSSAPTA